MEQRKLKKVLIHSIVFSPDGVSTAYLYNDIAKGLIDAGLDVVVLTTTPHYNLVDSVVSSQNLSKEFFGLYSRSNFEGIKVYHIPLKKYNSTFKRILSFIYWHFTSFIFGIFIRNIDYVLSVSPPLSIGFVSLLISKLKGAKAIYNVQEIYPDLLIKQGKIRSKLAINMLTLMEKIIYDYSDAIITIDDFFYSKLIPRIKNPNKLAVIPNFVDTNLYRPSQYLSPDNKICQKDKDKFILLYAGNIGHFQDWEPIFFSAQELSEENIEFWIIGEGVQKNHLQSRVSNGNFKNIKIFPYQTRQLISEINNYADIHFISTNQEMEQEGFPSKVYTIMACAKPLIVITGKSTPLYEFLKNKNCAILVSHDRNKLFTSAIRRLVRDENLRKKLGSNGYSEIIKCFSKEVVVSKYSELIVSLKD